MNTADHRGNHPGYNTGQQQGGDRPVDASVVLRRAIEIDHVTFDGDLDEQLDPSMLADIARQVGVSPTAVAAAVAEARAGALEDRSVLDRIIGPRRISSNRVFVADDTDATERLLEWLEVAHGLRPRVRPDGVIVARRRRDLAGKVGSGIRKVQGLGGLSDAGTVQAVAIGTEGEPEPAAVCVVADVGTKRRDAIVGGSVVAVSLSAAVSMVAVLAGPVVLVGIPVAAGVGTAIARTAHRSTVNRMTESVDDTLDGVAQGDEPPHPIKSLVRKRRPRSGPNRFGRNND